ncbi:MAG: hypothetical protein BWY06_03026 [Candidatus Latescibacteria bacterium ADurb.Bin168]|nr:MAG: hypothetical protein BWY06_03026 [Candidatus Latescibacteria bacterium ADurb.Bin168]
MVGYRLECLKFAPLGQLTIIDVQQREFNALLVCQSNRNCAIHPAGCEHYCTRFFHATTSGIEIYDTG